MQIANHEENQQLAAPAVAEVATVFCHFQVYYKLNIVSSYIWMDSRLKGLSIESNNTQNRVLTKALCKLQAMKKNQHLAATAVAAEAIVFCHFQVYYKLNIVSSYIWMDSRLKGLSIESNNTQNRVLTKELCKLQAMKKNQQLAATAVAAAAAATVFCHFRTSFKLKIVSRYIWVDSRLKGLSIESKNT